VVQAEPVGTPGCPGAGDLQMAPARAVGGEGGPLWRQPERGSAHSPQEQEVARLEPPLTSSRARLPSSQGLQPAPVLFVRHGELPLPHSSVTTLSFRA
jgi:hypothetical protein